MAARADRKVALLVVGRVVAEGTVVTASDLRSSLVVPGAGLSSIPTADVQQVVGRRATVSLLPGTLLA
ncbi:MAG: SAF domain-containing protein, partial [Actinomycetota bacterium]|nr:SAF domain-containing protein [Actinomycetota bacterium]